jgi:hypothetical protein
MAPFRILPLIAAAVSIAAVCAPIQAQTDTPEDFSATHLKVRQVPEAVDPEPFALDNETTGPIRPVELRTMDEMTEKDRELAADAEGSVGEHAGFFALGFNQGKWSYEELVCPALPNHIFLRYTRNNGAGDLSLFTASIPRGGDGRVRIIPIQMRGYSLWSPAPINALTISAFNHIRAEEDQDNVPDWLGTALCYSALAGARFQRGSGKSADSAIPADSTGRPDSRNHEFPAAIPATLQIPERGGAIIEFTDGSVTPRLWQWTMSFDRKGRLLKATHTPAGWLTVNAVPASAGELKGAPVPPTIEAIDSSGSAIR